MKPAIFITGAHHPRELTSVQMPLFSILMLLHGMIHSDSNDDLSLDLLVQNKYYVVPVVNVDGVALIERHWTETGHFFEKRKNMNPKYKELCKDQPEFGVDLNRNYGVSWAKPGGSSDDPCALPFRGDYPFSEPETRAIRDFLVSHQNEIKFVYNFHAYANMWLWPYNGQSQNNIARVSPDAFSVF